MKALQYILPLFISSLAFADTLVVTSLDDSGTGTLREAITNAVDNDYIVFDSSLSGTIVLQSTLPTVQQNYLSILGPLDNSITIDGDSLYRIFDTSGGDLTISNLNLNNGADSNQGGAFHLAQDKMAYLTEVVITPASGSYGSNAIFVEPGGVLGLTDVTYTSASASQIYLNSGSLDITSNIPMSFIIDGVNEGQVYKYGNSTLAISTPTSVTSNYFLTVTEGLMSFTGSLDAPATIFFDGTLYANATVTDIANLGTVRPGDGSNFGILHFTGDYYVFYGNTQIKINASGSMDELTINGDAFLTGAALNILPASGTYTSGTKYKFLTTGGAVNGTFGSVSMGGLDIQINYELDSVEIEILTTATI